jgi:type II secretory pathway pseudopilin PulG
MLVVLVIIGILAAIVVTLAQRVSQGGKFHATRNALEVADGLLTDYVSRRESQPPSFVRTNQTQMNTTGSDDQVAAEEYMFPLIDGRYDSRTFGAVIGGGPPPKWDKDRDPAQPTAALLLLQMVKESPEIDRELKGLDQRFLQRRDVFAYGWLIDAATQQPTGAPVLRRLRIPVLLDAFGNQLRYVHPSFQGGWGNYFDNADPPASTVRKIYEMGVSRNNGAPLTARFTRSYRPFGANTPNNPVGDADEGLAVGGHGYFYSPGLDGDPGTREDNVYTKVPSFPQETATLN